MKRTITAFLLCACILPTVLYGCARAGFSKGENTAFPSPAAPPSPAGSTAPQVAPDYALEYEDEYEADMIHGGYDGEAYEIAASDPPVSPETGGGSVQQKNVGERKIVYTTELSLQTKEFETGIAMIEEITVRYQGFVQSSSIQGRSLHNDLYGRRSPRYANYTVRVPESGSQAFIAELEGIFNVVYNNRYTDDITADYFDVKARLDSLETQRERLGDMLEKAEDVEYLLKVQRELARVVYEIEALTSSINRMDDAVNFSTVNLSIEEVLEYDDVQPMQATFAQRVSGAFSGSWRSFGIFWQDFAVGFVATIPFLIVFLPVLALVIIFILRKSRGRRGAESRRNDAQDSE